VVDVLKELLARLIVSSGGLAGSICFGLLLGFVNDINIELVVKLPFFLLFAFGWLISIAFMIGAWLFNIDGKLLNCFRGR
jgi:hypothetical protein